MKSNKEECFQQALVDWLNKNPDTDAPDFQQRYAKAQTEIFDRIYAEKYIS